MTQEAEQAVYMAFDPDTGELLSTFQSWEEADDYRHRNKDRVLAFMRADPHSGAKTKYLRTEEVEAAIRKVTENLNGPKTARGKLLSSTTHFL